jgi:hypothetical protein
VEKKLKVNNRKNDFFSSSGNNSIKQKFIVHKIVLNSRESKESTTASDLLNQ